jgi:hypothetical protein
MSSIRLQLAVEIANGGRKLKERLYVDFGAEPDGQSERGKCVSQRGDSKLDV